LSPSFLVPCLSHNGLKIWDTLAIAEYLHEIKPEARLLCTRFLTYDVAIDAISAGYCRTVMALAQMQEWVAAAKLEPDELEELDVEF
jgi:glutathione S-transferase